MRGNEVGNGNQRGDSFKENPETRDKVDFKFES